MAPPAGPDLPAVRARYQLAREAGRHMDPTEGGQPLTRAGYNAVVASWQDVAPLHDALRRAAAALADVDGALGDLVRLLNHRPDLVSWFSPTTQEAIAGYAARSGMTVNLRWVEQPPVVAGG